MTFDRCNTTTSQSFTTGQTRLRKKRYQFLLHLQLFFFTLEIVFYRLHIWIVQELTYGNLSWPKVLGHQDLCQGPPILKGMTFIHVCICIVLVLNFQKILQLIKKPHLGIKKKIDPEKEILLLGLITPSN